MMSGVGRYNMVSTHGEMVVGVSDIVERVRVVAYGCFVGQRVVHDVVGVHVPQITGGRGVPRVDWNRAGQGNASSAAGKGRLTAAAALWGSGPWVLVVDRGHGRGNRQRVRAVVNLVPVVAQRRSGARLHFDVRHVG